MPAPRPRLRPLPLAFTPKHPRLQPLLPGCPVSPSKASPAPSREFQELESWGGASLPTYLSLQLPPASMGRPPHDPGWMPGAASWPRGCVLEQLKPMV